MHGLVESREQAIKAIAFNIYQLRSRLGIPGHHKQDWYDAEKYYESVITKEKKE